MRGEKRRKQKGKERREEERTKTRKEGEKGERGTGTSYLLLSLLESTKESS